METFLVQLRDAVDAQGAGRSILIDLDNVGQPSPGLARAQLAALLEAAGEHAVAVAAGRDLAHAAFAEACEDLGVLVWEAEPVPNGADLVLLACARTLADEGVRDFVVISGDHAFAELPGRVRVVMPRQRSVAGALSTTADDVELVEVPRSTRNARSRASRGARRRRAAARQARGDTTT